MSKNEEVTETPDLPPLPDPNVPAAGEPPVAPVPSPSFPPPGGEYPASPTFAASAAPMATPMAPAPRTEGTAVAALVCAILSWFLLPIVLAVVALVLARGAEKAIDAAPAELTGRGLVSGARWVAWIHLVLAAMVVAFLSAFMIALWVGR